MPLLVVAGVVVTVAAGYSKGMWIDNLHNGLLAPSFAFVAPTCCTRGHGIDAGGSSLQLGSWRR